MNVYAYLEYKEHLEHHGVKDMKWGIQNGPPYPLDDDPKVQAERKEDYTPEKESTKKTFMEKVAAAKKRHDEKVEVLKKEKAEKKAADKKAADEQAKADWKKHKETVVKDGNIEEMYKDFSKYTDTEVATCLERYASKTAVSDVIEASKPKEKTVYEEEAEDFVNEIIRSGDVKLAYENRQSLTNAELEQVRIRNAQLAKNDLQVAANKTASQEELAKKTNAMSNTFKNTLNMTSSVVDMAGNGLRLYNAVASVHNLGKSSDKKWPTVDTGVINLTKSVTNEFKKEAEKAKGNNGNDKQYNVDDKDRGKLNDSLKARIKSMAAQSGTSYQDIADQLGISKSTVGAVINNQA